MASDHTTAVSGFNDLSLADQTHAMNGAIIVGGLALYIAIFSAILTQKYHDKSDKEQP